MTGSTALDTVIGLVFIYSLYSLLTTTITELLATILHQRAAFLAKGISRMLDDGSGTSVFSSKFFGQPLIKYLRDDQSRFRQWIMSFKVVQFFFGNTRDTPSYLSAKSFSKALMEVLNQESSVALKKTAVLDAIKQITKPRWRWFRLKNPDEQAIYQMVYKALLTPQDEKTDFAVLDAIKAELPKLSGENVREKIITILEEAERSLEKLDNLRLQDQAQRIRFILDNPPVEIAGSETIRFIRSLLDDAQNDLEKFKVHLEQWYDDTMERVTGWYKKRIQLITFFVGLGLAVWLNADTMRIIHILSTDKEARGQMVDLAKAYIENHPASISQGNTQLPSPGQPNYDSVLQVRVDSLLKVRKELEKDIEAANTLLGLGWDFPDSVALFDSAFIAANKYSPAEYLKVLVDSAGNQTHIRKKYILLGKGQDAYDMRKLLPQKKGYVSANKECTSVRLSETRFFWRSIWGYILTAIALSLGAPFWFDLLNKLMKLRSSIPAGKKTGPETATINSTDKQPITAREG